MLFVQVKMGYPVKVISYSTEKTQYIVALTKKVDYCPEKKMKNLRYIYEERKIIVTSIIINKYSPY